MYIFIIYLFVSYLGITSSIEVESELIDAYLGASKTAKLINLIQKLKRPQEDELLRRFSSEVKKDTPNNNYESMKLLQKNYDTGKQFDINNTRIHVQYISNPEVLDIYRKGPIRRDAALFSLQRSEEFTPEWAYALNYDTRHSSYPKPHYLSNPSVLKDFRRLIKNQSPEVSQSKEEDDENPPESDAVQLIKKVLRTKDKEPESSENNEFKLEETMDLVKPFFVQVFNKIKDKDNPTETKDKEKPTKDASDTELLKPEDIETNILKKLYNKKNNALKEVINIDEAVNPEVNNVYIKEKLKAPAQAGKVKEKGKKEKLKEKYDENNADYIYDDKTLPLRKKSFVERGDGIDDDNGYRNKDTGYGTNGKNKGNGWERSQYRNSHSSNHKTESERKSKKEDSIEVNKYANEYSEKKRFNKKKSNDNLDKDKISEENYSDRGAKKKKLDDNWDKKDDKWNKKNDDWNKKDEKWNKKNDDWNKKDDKWNKKNDDWNKKDEQWNKKDDWDNNYDKWNKKNVDGNKKDDKWNKKNEDWDDKWNKKNDDWDKKDDKWNKKNDDWNKKDEKWNKKNEDWDKKDDKWNKKSDDWNKKDEKWNKRNEDWDEKDNKWNKKSKDWKKQEDNWDNKGDGDDKWNSKKDNWDKKNDNWNLKKDKNKKDDSDSEYGKKAKEDNWDTRHEDYDNKDKRNKKDTWKSKEIDNKNKKTYNSDEDWDKKQKDDDVSFVKDKKSYKDNAQWGSYNSFKTSKSVPVSYEDMEMKKDTNSGFKPKIINNWDNEPRNKKSDQRSGPIFGRTPIPFRGSRSVYD